MISYIDILGFVAGALTTLSLLPEIIRTAKMKETRDISPVWIELAGVGIFLWLVYGVLINSLPLIAANGVSLLSVFALAYLKIKYK